MPTKEVDDLGLILIEIDRGGYAVIAFSVLNGAPSIAARRYLLDDLRRLKRKMEPHLYWRTYYNRVIHRLGDPAAAKVLHHADNITLAMLDALDRVEPAFHHPRLIPILNTPERLPRFQCITTELRRVLLPRRRPAAWKALAGSDVFGS